MKDDELIELGLSRRSTVLQQDGPIGSMMLVEGLLSLLAEMISPVKELNPDVFREALNGYREKVSDSEDVDSQIAKSCIDDCETYFRELRNYGVRREEEISQILEMLYSALAEEIKDSDSFNERLYVTSDRFKRMADIEDIRDLKRMVSQEVREFRRVVLEKQEQDEKRHSEFSKQIGDLKARLQIATAEASSDPLTSVANRGTFDRNIRRLVEQKKTFVLAMMDIDHFKSINDSHGHRIGDNVILCASKWIGDSVRGSDLVARYGGDEFALLLVDTNLRTAEQRLSVVVNDVANRSYVYNGRNGKTELRFTVSCGLAEFSSGDTADHLIQRADEALYDAKKVRNHVCSRKKSRFGGLF